jgi:ribosomal protein L11 methyltransferase
LAARGALGCAVQWPHKVRRSPNTAVTLQAFFNRLSNAQLKAHRAALDAAGMLAGSGPAAAVALTDPGWATMWKRRFKPLRIGRRFIILPPWNPDAPADRIPIIIDPGQGFGTGHHATTRSTLIGVETECTRRPVASALDVGAGSGVLALAMARLGVKRIVALDNDPLALDNARHNAELNCCSQSIRFSLAPLRSLRRPFALITVNILSSTLIALAPELKRLLAPGGCLILSGILNREAAEVMSHYPPPIRRLWSRRERGWTTLVLARPQ